jgi:uncharacterized protein YidB (DUF937 family)
MGLRDILIGMQNGPRGQRPPPGSGGSSGMSPLTIALLALLAYKAFKGRGAQAGAQTIPAGQPGGGTSLPRGSTANSGGGLGDLLGGLFGGGGRSASASANPEGSLGGLLQGGLGGLLGGAAAGGLITGALGNILQDFQQSGQTPAARSWIASGPNEEISPGELERALGSDTLDALSQHTGMGRRELLEGLSQNLPDLIDQLTPSGRLPTEEEAARMV